MVLGTMYLGETILIRQSYYLTDRSKKRDFEGAAPALYLAHLSAVI